MISIDLNNDHFSFVEKRAPLLNIGGRSNLNKNDLSKASRLEFQYTGLYGELSWYLYRYGNYDKFREVFDYKQKICGKTRMGDSGFDDSITANNKTRFLDVKSSFVEYEKRIQFLNLIVPSGEKHNNMIYVCAFTIGKNRMKIDRVMLAGWAINEDIKKIWFKGEKEEDTKYCVPVRELRDMKELDLYIR